MSLSSMILIFSLSLRKKLKKKKKMPPTLPHTPQKGQDLPLEMTRLTTLFFINYKRAGVLFQTESWQAEAHGERGPCRGQ